MGRCSARTINSNHDENSKRSSNGKHSLTGSDRSAAGGTLHSRRELTRRFELTDWYKTTFSEAYSAELAKFGGRMVMHAPSGLLLLLMFLAACMDVLAGPTATLTGRVTDTTGGVI